MPPARVRLLDRPQSARGYLIRDLLTRSVVDFDWIALHSDADCLEALGVGRLAEAGLPVVELPDGERLADPELAELAARLGWITHPRAQEYDLSIFGAGPAGLSAAMYAASEGLRVVLVERDAVGGQAGSSSLIENYLGFPHGISGAELAERARQQAVDFGADLLRLNGGVSADYRSGRRESVLADGTRIVAQAKICATGIEWTRLGVPGDAELGGRGVYYGAGTSEAPQCRDLDVVVVGGGNSAGQAVMNLSAHARRVTMLVRGASLADHLSQYLVDRISTRPNVEVRLGAEVEEFLGGPELEAVRVGDAGGGSEVLPASRAFVCVGGRPNSGWAEDTVVERDAAGYVLTDRDLSEAARAAFGREPFPLETSAPGVFAAGDVRHGSVKRVASAVGEGAMAISSVHRYLRSLED